MSTSLSFIYQATDRVRAYLDLSSFEAKYDDTWILRNLLMPAARDLAGRMNNNMMNTRIIEEFDISVVKDTQTYQIPPGVRHVLGFVYLDEDGRIEEDHQPSNFYDREGSWRIEGFNSKPYLWIDKTNPAINRTRTMRMYYVGLQDFEWHYGDTGLTPAVSTFELDGSPNVGFVDRRPYAYVGGLLRIFDVEDGNEILETTVSAYNPVFGQCTTKFPMTKSNGDTISTEQESRVYEIVPSYGGTYMDAVTAGAILKGANLVKMASSQKRDLEMEYKAARKTLIDDISDMNLRVPPHIRRDTRDRQMEVNTQMRWTT